MSKKVTIQDIANELGMSRNTISKALNDQPLPQKTKELILKKALAMGYKGVLASPSNLTLVNEKIHILIVTNKPLGNISFFMSTVKGMENYSENKNIVLFQYTLPDATNISLATFHQYLKTNQISGIVGIEIFDELIIKALFQTLLPVTFIDSHRFINQFSEHVDVILMDNFYSVFHVSTQLINAGITEFGFIGDYTHCRGFFERFSGLKEALFAHNITYNQDFSITEPDDCPYGQMGWMLEKIQNLHALPQAFICANDSIAITLIHALNFLNIKIPDQIQIIGFDNISESEHITPSLTTIHTPKELLGQEAIQLLVNRIINPKTPSKIQYINTTAIYRNSTKNLTT